MTTTHHRTSVAGRITDLAQARERRLSTLLARREELGQRWAEALSHQLPNGEELAYEIAVVEQAICDQFPAVFDAQITEWLSQDAVLLHHPGDVAAECRRCRVEQGRPGVA